MHAPKSPLVSIVMMLQQEDRLVPLARTEQVSAITAVARAVLQDFAVKARTDDPILRELYALEGRRVRETLRVLGIVVEDLEAVA